MSRPAGRTTEVEDLLRRHAPQVLGALVRRYGHFDAAEDAVQEALLAAAGAWPSGGVPDNPRGRLIKVASRRLTDALRSEEARRLREERSAALTPRDARAEPDAPEPELGSTRRLDAVRAHLLERAGDTESARGAYESAARKTLSLPEQRYPQARAARLKA